MKKISVLLFSVTTLSGCVNFGHTFKAEHYFSSEDRLKPYLYILNPSGMHSEANYNASDKSISLNVSTRSISNSDTISEIIQGTAMKCGIAVVSSSDIVKLGKDAEFKTLEPKWAVSGRTNRGIGYSQELSVTLARYSDKTIIYRGIGEYMGAAEEDDIRGASIAAMSGLCEASKLPEKPLKKSLNIKKDKFDADF